MKSFYSVINAYSKESQHVNELRSVQVSMVNAEKDYVLFIKNYERLLQACGNLESAANMKILSHRMVREKLISSRKTL